MHLASTLSYAAINFLPVGCSHERTNQRSGRKARQNKRANILDPPNCTQSPLGPLILSDIKSMAACIQVGLPLQHSEKVRDRYPRFQIDLELTAGMAFP